MCMLLISIFATKYVFQMATFLSETDFPEPAEQQWSATGRGRGSLKLSGLVKRTKSIRKDRMKNWKLVFPTTIFFLSNFYYYFPT